MVMENTIVRVMILVMGADSWSKTQQPLQAIADDCNAQLAVSDGATHNGDEDDDGANGFWCSADGTSGEMNGIIVLYSPERAFGILMR